MTEKQESITPQQAADVIFYYHEGENHETRQKGSRDKITLGESALHTIDSRHSILSDNKTPLTALEMKRGVEYIVEAIREAKIDSYGEKLDKLVDKLNIPYSEARAILDREMDEGTSE